MSLMILIFQLVFVSLKYSSATNNGCNFADISEKSWDVSLPISINDDQKQRDIFRTEYEGNIVVGNCTDDYFRIYKNDTHLIIETTENFDNFDLDTRKQVESSIELTIFVCHIECLGDSTLWLVMNVTDSNNHPPTFKNLDLEYIVASPIMPGMDFTIYGSTIVAEDIDFSNQNVTFTIEPDDFQITTLSSSGSKEYAAVFKAKRIIEIDDSKQYIITITDSGTNPGVLSTSQSITLKTDPSTSYDIPAFQAPSYSFSYSEKDGKCTLTPKDGLITLKTNKPNEINDHLELIGDFKEHFEPVFASDTKTVTISCINTISTTSPIVILSLRVTTDAVASVPIVIFLDDVEVKTPERDSHVYIENVDVNNSEENLRKDEIIPPCAAEVDISGSYGNNEDIVANNE